MRETYRTGGFEDVAGYSRAVRHGDWIAVSTTAPTGSDGKALHPGDTYLQAKLAFERALEAVEKLGGTTADVLRTRLYLTHDSEWRRAVDAHKEFFGDTTPANSTFYVAGFIPEGVLVEVELDALAGSGD